MFPFAYVTRKDEDVPAVAPPLQAGHPHSEVHGAIEGEMIMWALHTHAMFRDDNAAVYYALEEATCSTSYAASIKSFQRMKNGRGALQALTNQYDGNDNGEQKSANKMTYSIHECGRANQTSHWKVSLLSTAMHSCQCNSVRNTLHISSQMSTLQLDT